MSSAASTTALSSNVPRTIRGVVDCLKQNPRYGRHHHHHCCYTYSTHHRRSSPIVLKKPVSSTSTSSSRRAMDGAADENYSVRSTASTACLTADGSEEDSSIMSSNSSSSYNSANAVRGVASSSSSTPPLPPVLCEISISPAFPSSSPKSKSSRRRNKKSRKSRTSPTKKKRKRVQFVDASENLSYENAHHVYKEDLKDLWYDNQDFADFREAATLCAMEVMAAQQLEEAQEQASSIYQYQGSYHHHPRGHTAREPPRPESSATTSTLSYPQTLERLYQACVRCQNEPDNKPSDASILSKAEERRLQKCLAKTTSRWGVERTAVRWIAMDKHYRRSAIVDLVLEMQQTFSLCLDKSSSGTSGDKNNSSSSSRTMIMEDRSDLDEVLRQSCEALSRPSRLFARHLAQASAAAVVDDR